MIFGDLAILLNVAFIAVSGYFYVTAAVSIAFLFSRKRRAGFSAKCRQRLLWSVVVLPGLVGLALAALILMADALPAPLIDFAHWHHLEVFRLDSWHGLVLMLFGVIFSRALYLSVKSILRHKNAVRTIFDLEAMGQYQKNAVNGVYAVTAGFLKPRALIGAAMKTHLTTEEFDIVGRHELAHVRNYDPLRKLCFAFLTAFFPPSIRRRLGQELSLCLEQIADESTVSDFRDRINVASTLLKVCRLTREQSSYSHLCHFGVSEIEARVHYLLQPISHTRFPYLSLGLLLVALLISSVSILDIYHHAIEVLFSH